MARFRKALLILGLVAGLAAVAAVLWRQPLVEAAARRALAANGLDEARLEVVEVGADAIVIESLSLGPDLPEIARLRLAYTLRELASGRLDTLRVEGLRHTAPAEIDAALEPLAPLLPGDGGGGWFTLARIEIEDGLITLAGSVRGTIGLDGAFDLSGDSPGAALDIGLDLGGASGAFTLRSEALGESGLVEIDGGGQAELTGLALPAAGASLTGGLARYTLGGSVRIPHFEEGLEALRAEGVAALAGGLELVGVTSTATQGALAADIGWTLEAGGGRARLALSRPSVLSVTGIPAEALAAMGLSTPDGMQTLSAELVPSGPLIAWMHRAEGGSVELAADLALSLGEARATARAEARFDHGADFDLLEPATISAEVEASGLALAGAGFAGTLGSGAWSVTGSASPSGELALEGPLAAQLRELSTAAGQSGAVTVDGLVRLSGRPGRWSVSAAPGLVFLAEGASVPGRIALSGPLALTAETLALETGGAAVRLDLRGRVAPVSGALLTGAGGELAFTGAAGGLAVSATIGEGWQGELTLAEAGITLPSHDVAATGLSARFPLGAEGPVAMSGRLRDTGAARFPPLDLVLEGRRKDEALSFSGSAEAPAAGVRFPVDGSADLARATGRMTISPARLSFRRGGLQPGALTSLLPPLADVAGGVRLTADVTFDSGAGMRSTASLDLDDLSLRSGEVAVEGLAGRLSLARLVPLATAGVQELTARSVTVGVPLEGARARFTAEARGRGLAVHIREATGGLAGGTVLVEDAHWNSAASSSAFDVRVRDVQLSRLLSDWHIEGISGTGRLAGVIPVRVTPSGVAVDDGRLDAAGPGVIQVDWGSAHETLVDSGEQVALTVRALEDFHYDSLSLGIDQPPDGDLMLAIGLEGANPEVLDGHPFRFNINLSGELAPILEAVREGQRIGAGLLSGGLGGR